MGLIHADNQIIKLRQNIGKRHTEFLMILVELKLGIRFAVENLANVEDEQLDFRCLLQLYFALDISRWIESVIFAIKHLRSAHLSFQSLKDILGVAGVGLLTEFFINGIARGQNEEMLISLCLIQVVDTCTHQTGFTNTCCHMVAEGRKIKFLCNRNLLRTFAVLACDRLDFCLGISLVICLFGDRIKI